MRNTSDKTQHTYEGGEEKLNDWKKREKRLAKMQIASIIISICAILISIVKAIN